MNLKEEENMTNQSETNSENNEIKSEKTNDQSKLPKLPKDADTIVIPMLQMKQLHIQENERLMDIIMKIIDNNSDYWRNIYITSGYLNFTNEFKKLLQEINTEIDIICAAPQVCFFFNP